jgi:hypothetical protein
MRFQVERDYDAPGLPRVENRAAADRLAFMPLRLADVVAGRAGGQVREVRTAAPLRVEVIRQL